MPDMSFRAALAQVLRHEGGYVNDPRDPGGETRYGISKRSYPAEDIKNLTLARAGEIYRRDFWDRCRCDEMPPAIRMHLFDAAVNSGPVRAIRWLQEAARVERDGVIGPITIREAWAADPVALVARYNGLRLDYLTDLRGWASFGRGWTRRVATNLLHSGNGGHK